MKSQILILIAVAAVAVYAITRKPKPLAPPPKSAVAEATDLIGIAIKGISTIADLLATPEADEAQSLEGTEGSEAAAARARQEYRDAEARFAAGDGA